MVSQWLADELARLVDRTTLTAELATLGTCPTCWAGGHSCWVHSLSTCMVLDVNGHILLYPRLNPQYFAQIPPHL